MFQSSFEFQCEQALCKVNRMWSCDWAAWKWVLVVSGDWGQIYCASSSRPSVYRTVSNSASSSTWCLLLLSLSLYLSPCLFSVLYPYKYCPSFTEAVTFLNSSFRTGIFQQQSSFKSFLQEMYCHTVEGTTVLASLSLRLRVKSLLDGLSWHLIRPCSGWGTITLVVL